MNKQDYNTLKEILRFTRAGSGEAQIIMDFVRKHIDSKMVFCLRCSTQIRLAHRKVKLWYEANKEWIEGGKACKRCGEIFQATSTRNTICNKCKK